MLPEPLSVSLLLPRPSWQPKWRSPWGPGSSMPSLGEPRWIKLYETGTQAIRLKIFLKMMEDGKEVPANVECNFGPGWVYYNNHCYLFSSVHETFLEVGQEFFLQKYFQDMCKIIGVESMYTEDIWYFSSCRPWIIVLTVLSVRESAPRREDTSEHHFSRLSQSLLIRRKKLQSATGPEWKRKRRRLERRHEVVWSEDPKSEDQIPNDWEKEGGIFLLRKGS